MNVLPKTVPHLFPEIKTLNGMINASEDLSYPSLMSPTLKTLHVDAFIFGPFGRTMIPHVPSLRVLEIKGMITESPGTVGWEETFNKLLSSSSMLEAVIIAECFASQMICTTLHQLPNLVRVEIIFDEFRQQHLRLCSSKEGDHGQMSLDCLKQLSFVGSAQKFHDYFQDVFKLSSLTNIHLRLDGHEEAKFEPIFHVITSQVPRLVALEVGEFMSSTLAPIPWSATRLVQNCPNLSTLVLHNCEAPRNSSELTKLLVSRTQTTPWKKIIIHTHQPLKADVLLLFAKHCPQITSLGVSIDASRFAVPFPQFETDVPFPLLDKIDFGPSPVSLDWEDEVGTFLFGIFDRPLIIRGKFQRFWDSVARWMINHSRLYPEGINPRKAVLFQNAVYQQLAAKREKLKDDVAWDEAQTDRWLSSRLSKDTVNDILAPGATRLEQLSHRRRDSFSCCYISAMY